MYATATQTQLIADTQQALVDDAVKRRGPSTLKEDKYFSPSDVVRRVNDKYVMHSQPTREAAQAVGTQRANS